ncbi:hypothetical protein CDL15_Pgr022611 [Punica granatum]|uniref:Phorbol-ester/DAG-type domain-containing protein n=1 Tax=Punica granatum TaxID=22663 RepID=A0A218XRQ5_PUNGR|nr:hypothetical protein CDL15_Pgr022611 [Punica granatum]
MAVVVTGPDAKPVGSRRCMFELKEYTRPFTCRVCTVNSYDTVRYRCDHCDECRHVSCIRLDEEIRVGPGPATSLPCSQFSRSMKNHKQVVIIQ